MTPTAAEQPRMEIADDRITVYGDLTLRTARQFYRQTPTIVARETHINLTAVGETDSAGLALLIHWHHQAAAQNTNLIYTNPPPQLRQMAKISGVGGMFERA